MQEGQASCSPYHFRQLSEEQVEEEHEQNQEPVVIVSDEQTPPVHFDRVFAEVPEMDVPEVELANRKQMTEQDQQRRRQEKYNKAMEMMQKIEKEKINAEQAKDQLERKEKKRQAQKQLRRQFQTHLHLPVSSLYTVSRALSKFQEQCKLEKLPREERTFAKPRYQNRRNLTRVMLLAVQELKHKVSQGQRSKIEEKLIRPQTDALKMCYTFASQLESDFFLRLCKLPKKSGELYQKQIKLIIREFNDKNNIVLRRQIFNKQIPNAELAQAQSDDLKCQKTKLQEKARIQQLVRESQKDPLVLNEMNEQPQEIPDLNPMASVGSFQSAVDIQKRQEQKKQQLKVELLQSSMKAYQKCINEIQRYKMLREKRKEMMKGNFGGYDFFVEMCKEYGI